MWKETNANQAATNASFFALSIATAYRQGTLTAQEALDILWQQCGLCVQFILDYDGSVRGLRILPDTCTIEGLNFSLDLYPKT